MSDIATAVVNKLRNDAGVAAQIGARLYPSYDRLADRTYPLAVFKLDVTPVVAFDGPTGVMTAVLELAAVAASYAAAVAAGNAIYAALEFARGTWDGVVVQGCFAQEDGERDDVVTDPTTEEVLFYVKVFRFDLTFNT